jgi:hypothetical protein
LPRSFDLTTKVPSQALVLKVQLQSPHSSVTGPVLQETPSGFTPRLKKPVMVMLTSQVPSASSQMPQSQLPVVSVQGSTTVGGDQVTPPSLDWAIRVWPESWWIGNRSSLNTATSVPSRSTRVAIWLMQCSPWRKMSWWLTSRMVKVWSSPGS